MTIGLSHPFPWIHVDTVITLMSSFQGQGKPAVMVRTSEQINVHGAFYGMKESLGKCSEQVGGLVQIG